MGAIETLRDALFGNPPSPTTEPSREGTLAAFTELYNQAVAAVAVAAQGITTVANIAARDAFYATPGNQSKLVYVNNNNGSATDPANGVYEYVSGAPRLAESFYAGVTSLVQPLVDAAEAAQAGAEAAETNIATTIRNFALTSGPLGFEGRVQVFNGATAVAGPPAGFDVPSGSTGHLSFVSSVYYPTVPFRSGEIVVISNEVTLSVGNDRSFGHSLAAITAAFPLGTPRAATITTETIGGKTVVHYEFVAAAGDLGYIAAVQVFDASAAGSDQTVRLTSASWTYKNARSTVASVGDRVIDHYPFADGYRLNPRAQIVTVGSSGAQFSHPKLARDAIAALGDHGLDRPYVILMDRGSYGGYAEWHTLDGVDLVGLGRKEDVVVWYENDNSASSSTIRNTSLFWHDTISSLVNFTAWIRNGRYVSHLETSGARPFSRQNMFGVDFQHRGNALAVNNDWATQSQIAVGAGNSRAQIIRARGSIFKGPGGGFSYHTPNDGLITTNPTETDLEGCVFTATDPACAALRIVPVTVGGGDICRLVGNSFNGPILYETSQWVSGDTTTRRDQIDVFGWGNTPVPFMRYIVGGSADGPKFRPRFTDEEVVRKNDTGSSIPFGTVLAFDSDPRFIRPMTSSDAAFQYAGVAWVDIDAGAFGRVKTGGQIELGVDVFYSGGSVPVGASFSIDPTMPGRLAIGGPLGLLPVVSVITSPVSGSASVIVQVARP